MNSATTVTKRKPLKVGIWVVIHATLLLLGLCCKWNVETDLYSILPDSSEFKNVSAAEKALSGRTMQNISLLLGHENFETAKVAAESVNSSFASDSAFESVRFLVDAGALKETRNFLYDHRLVLQGPEVRNALLQGDEEYLKNAAMEKIYGVFSMADLSHLDEDPYLLGEQSFDFFTLNNPLMSGKFSIRDDMLVATDVFESAGEKNTADSAKPIHYIMWSAVLSSNTSALAADGHVLGRLNKTLDSLQNALPGLKVAKSGVPFHSFESSQNAQSEVAWISGISLVLIFALLLFVYRSALPIVATLLSIGVAIAAALSGTWLLFGSIHVFTFVFGTSVIGVSIDYAIHFFTERHGIFKGLLLGFMTTELSYFALTFAGFDLLRQMAVFSLIGLASSFLTIVLLFPSVLRERELPINTPRKMLDTYDNLLMNRSPWRVRVLLVAFVAVLLPGIFKLNVQTDMGSVYTMSEQLKASEVLNARLNDLGISPNYFIVEGKTIQEVLEREESLKLRLDSARKDSLLKDYLAASTYVPSLKTQHETYEAAKKLGSSSENPGFVTFESELPVFSKNILDMLWIGKVNGMFYSAVMPLHPAKEFHIQEWSDVDHGIFAVNKMENINGALTELSRKALLLVACAYVLVLIILTMVYKWRVAISVIRAPVIGCLFLAAVFGYCGIAFNFFAIVGVILTLGIGIDYALFFREGGQKNYATALSVMLSAATTLISFGSLAFSGFIPVSTFGFATLLGISCCFLLTPLSQKKSNIGS